MISKINFNSTEICRFSTVPVFFCIKNVLVPRTSHVKGLHVRTKFLPVPNNWTQVLARPDYTGQGLRRHENHIGQSFYSQSHISAAISKRFLLRQSPGMGVLPYRRLMGVCRWMGSHFQQSYQNAGAHFRIFSSKTVLHIYDQQTYQNVCTAEEKFF